MKFLMRPMGASSHTGLPWQGFDGLALGTAFVHAGFKWKQYLIYSLLFVLITPIGCAIGLGISSSYSPSSKAALACEAAFNSVSAGRLSLAPMDPTAAC